MGLFCVDPPQHFGEFYAPALKTIGDIVALVNSLMKTSDAAAADAEACGVADDGGVLDIPGM